MSLNDDIALIEAKIDAAVNLALRDDVGELAKVFLSQSVKENVYDKYNPRVYWRRKSEGGLMDIDTMESRYDPATKTLEVESMNVDDDTGRRVAPVVESGVGYNYIRRGAKYLLPRPFHKPAEDNLIKSGVVDNALSMRLTQAGFKVTKI